MANPLLDRATPAELADRRQVIETVENIGVFPDLAGILQEELSTLPAGKAPRDWRQLPVAIRLGFDWLDARRQFAALQGSVSATVAVVCQRCLEPFEMPLRVELKLRLTQAGDAAGEQQDCEDWELAGPTLRPLDVVEEALIMALPLAALHEGPDRCVALPGPLPADDAGMLRPFADLRAKMDELD